MSHARKEADQERDDGAIQALIEAERAWRIRLDAAQVEAKRIIADARAQAERAMAGVQSELGPSVEAHRAETATALQLDVAGIANDARERAARYTDVDDATIERLAADIARRVPWLAAAGAPEASR